MCYMGNRRLKQRWAYQFTSVLCSNEVSVDSMLAYIFWVETYNGTVYRDFEKQYSAAVYAAVYYPQFQYRCGNSC